MAIALAMSRDDDKDDHDHDMVMPGFRFHPTEEELVEFYLRRKVEGKRFNVELITFLDLYRYDPWELPALAAIGEKEWFFYVPRDRKYRNGDRPNRVTTSGYWKATGADRMIRTETLRSIGLKKTLVFYSGKAPKGIRTSWIMNEYRLPQHETDRYQKAEISLCRVYKRPGVDDHSPIIPRSVSASSSTPSSSRVDYKKQQQQQQQRSSTSTTVHQYRAAAPPPPPPPVNSFQAFGGHSPPPPSRSSEAAADKMQEADRSSCSNDGTGLGLSNNTHNRAYATEISPLLTQATAQEDMTTTLLRHSSSKEVGPPQLLPIPIPSCTTFFACSSSSSSSLPAPPMTMTMTQQVVDELHKLVGYTYQQQHQQQQQHLQQQQQSAQFFSIPCQQSQTLGLNTMPNSLPTFSDKIWEWNPIPDANRDYTNPFK